jgi:hypothetical protein
LAHAAVTTPLEMKEGKVSNELNYVFYQRFEKDGKEIDVQWAETRVAKDSNAAERILLESMLRIARAV